MNRLLTTLLLTSFLIVPCIAGDRTDTRPSSTSPSSKHRNHSTERHDKYDRDDSYNRYDSYRPSVQREHDRDSNRNRKSSRPSPQSNRRGSSYNGTDSSRKRSRSPDLESERKKQKTSTDQTPSDIALQLTQVKKERDNFSTLFARTSEKNLALKTKNAELEERDSVLTQENTKLTQQYEESVKKFQASEKERAALDEKLQQQKIPFTTLKTTYQTLQQQNTVLQTQYDSLKDEQTRNNTYMEGLLRSLTQHMQGAASHVIEERSIVPHNAIPAQLVVDQVGVDVRVDEPEEGEIREEGHATMDKPHAATQAPLTPSKTRVSFTISGVSPQKKTSSAPSSQTNSQREEKAILDLRLIDSTSFTGMLEKNKKNTSLTISNRAKMHHEVFENFNFQNNVDTVLSDTKVVDIRGKFSGLSYILNATILPNVEEIILHTYAAHPIKLFEKGEWKKMSSLETLKLINVSLSGDGPEKKLGDFFGKLERDLPASIKKIDLIFTEKFKEHTGAIDYKSKTDDLVKTLKKIVANYKELVHFKIDDVDVLKKFKE